MPVFLKVNEGLPCTGHWQLCLDTMQPEALSSTICPTKLGHDGGDFHYRPSYGCIVQQNGQIDLNYLIFRWKTWFWTSGFVLLCDPVTRDCDLEKVCLIAVSTSHFPFSIPSGGCQRRGEVGDDWGLPMVEGLPAWVSVSGLMSMFGQGKFQSWYNGLVYFTLGMNCNCFKDFMILSSMIISCYPSKNKTNLAFFVLLDFCLFVWFFWFERDGDERDRMRIWGWKEMEKSLGGVEGEENTIKIYCMKTIFN